MDLFDGLVITSDDIGHTFVADASSDANLVVHDMLTNGSNDEFWLVRELETGWAGGLTGFESSYLGSPGGAVDFAVTGLDEVRLTIESLVLSTRGNDPNGDGNWTDLVCSVRFDFVVIPAPPAGALLLLVGLGGVRRTRRRRERR